CSSDLIAREVWKAGLRMPYYAFAGVCFWIDPIVLSPRTLSRRVLSPERYFGACVGETFGRRSAELDRFLQRPGRFAYLSFGSMSARYEPAKSIIVRIA